MSHNHINWFLFSEEMRARFLFVQRKQPEIELQDLNLSSVLMKLERSILTTSLKCSFKWGYFTLFSSSFYFFLFFFSSFFLFNKEDQTQNFVVVFFSQESWPLPELSNLATLLSMGFFLVVFFLLLLSRSTYVEEIHSLLKITKVKNGNMEKQSAFHWQYLLSDFACLWFHGIHGISITEV